MKTNELGEALSVLKNAKIGTMTPEEISTL
jgi:hypothetical protein